MFLIRKTTFDAHYESAMHDWHKLCELDSSIPKNLLPKVHKTESTFLQAIHLKRIEDSYYNAAISSSNPFSFIQNWTLLGSLHLGKLLTLRPSYSLAETAHKNSIEAWESFTKDAKPVIQLSYPSLYPEFSRISSTFIKATKPSSSNVKTFTENPLRKEKSPRRDLLERIASDSAEKTARKEILIGFCTPIAIGSALVISQVVLPWLTSSKKN